jgi:ribonuclease D
VQHDSKRRPEERRFYTQVIDPMREARLIQDPGELEAALFRLRSSDRLALDTEFMRERTYHAQLCLVQIATESDCYLIDPLVDLNLAPLRFCRTARS